MQNAGIFSGELACLYQAVTSVTSNATVGTIIIIVDAFVAAVDAVAMVGETVVEPAPGTSVGTATATGGLVKGGVVTKAGTEEVTGGTVVVAGEWPEDGVIVLGAATTVVIGDMDVPLLRGAAVVGAGLVTAVT